MNSNINFDLLRKGFNKKKNITIISHINPDGDAIGSSLGLYLYLNKKNQNVKIIFPTDFPEFLKWLPGSKEIIILSIDNKKYIKKWIETSDYIFLLDFNKYSRIYPLDNLLRFSNSIKLMIDHHIDPMIYCNYMFNDKLSPSTCVLIYKFIEKMGDLNIIDSNIATCLYTGTATDTGFFRYSSVTSNTHITIAKLLDIGVNINYINDKLSAIHTFNRMNLLGKTLLNMKILEYYRTVYMIVSLKDLFIYKSCKNDTEGFVNYGLKIKNIVLSIIFIEEKNKKIKISFRSKGNFDVNFFAKKYFNGGGHKNASGGKSEKELKSIINYFLDIIPKYKNEINKINI